MLSLVLLAACSALGGLAVVVGRRLTSVAAGPGDVVAWLHLVGATLGMVVWLAFLIAVGEVGETAGSVVGIVALAGWWVAAAAGLVQLARGPAPLWAAVLAHGGLVVAVGVLTWAYATQVV